MDKDRKLLSQMLKKAKKSDNFRDQFKIIMTYLPKFSELFGKKVIETSLKGAVKEFPMLLSVILYHALIKYPDEFIRGVEEDKDFASIIISLF